MVTSGKKINRVHGEGIEIDPDEDLEWDPEEWIILCNKNTSTLKITGNGKENNKEGSCKEGCRDSSK